MMGVGAGQLGMGLLQGYQQSQIARQNAQVEEANIPYIRAQAAQQARQLQVGSYLTRGLQRTGYAKSGLSQGGSIFDVMNDTVANYNRDTNLVLLQGELEARAAQRRADLSRYQAKLGMFDAITGGLLKFGGTSAYAMSLPSEGKTPSVLGGSTQGPANLQTYRMLSGIPTSFTTQSFGDGRS